jgi:hypothetical protein
MIDQKVTHGDRCHAQEMGTISPIRVLGARELEVELVHQRCRRQRVTRTNSQLTTRGVT